MRAELHFHLLPGVDDGPKTRAEALELARLAVEDGTRLVVCTPHAHQVDVTTVADRVRELQDALRVARIPLELRAGGELTPGTPLTGSELACIAQGPPGRRWILLEAPLDGPSGDDFHAHADELEARGYGVLIAHPERSREVLAEPHRLEARLARGARLQVNASSLVGRHGPRPRAAGLELVRRGLVAAIASDAHRPTRPPRLTEALDVLRAEGLDDPALADSAPEALLRDGLRTVRRAA